MLVEKEDAFQTLDIVKRTSKVKSLSTLFKQIEGRRGPVVARYSESRIEQSILFWG